MNAEIQKANDMLAAMQAQRDNALNVIVNVQAELMATRRLLAEKDAEIANLQKANAELMKPPACAPHNGEDTTIPCGAA